MCRLITKVDKRSNGGNCLDRNLNNILRSSSVSLKANHVDDALLIPSNIAGSL